MCLCVFVKSLFYNRDGQGETTVQELWCICAGIHSDQYNSGVPTDNSPSQRNAFSSASIIGKRFYNVAMCSTQCEKNSNKDHSIEI